MPDRGGLIETPEGSYTPGCAHAWGEAMTPPSGEQITIAAGDQQAVIVEVGGGIRSYTAGGQDLIDGYGADEMASSGRGQVLLPWPNRLEDGSYEFAGRRYQLPLSEP